MVKKGKAEVLGSLISIKFKNVDQKFPKCENRKYNFSPSRKCQIKSKIHTMAKNNFSFFQREKEALNEEFYRKAFQYQT